MWNQKRADELREANVGLTSDNLATDYEEYLTSEGYNAISAAVKLVRSGADMNSELKGFELVDALVSPDLWDDFAGLAAYELARASTTRYAGTGRHQSGVALQISLGFLKKTALQNRKAFIQAQRNPLTREFKTRA